MRAVSFADGSLLTTIGESAFAECVALEGVCLPEALVMICTRAFGDCRGLTRVSFRGSPNVSVLGSRAFAGCVSLSEFQMPSTLREVHGDTFEGCAQMEKLEPPPKCRTVEEGCRLS